MADKYVIGLFQGLESEIIGDIVRRVKKTGRFTETAEIMAKSMMEKGYSPAKIRAEVMKSIRADKDLQDEIAKNTLEYKKFVKGAIKDTIKEAEKAGDKMTAEGGMMAFNEDLSLWEMAGQDLKKPNSLSQLINSFKAQTASSLRNITRTTGFKDTVLYSVASAYQREMDQALVKVATGTFSYDQAVNDCVHRLAQSGLRSVEYASGRSYQLDTAARMSVRTSMSQLSGRITEENIRSTGIDLVITSQHMGSRPEHAVWQNKVFSYSGKSKKYPDFFKETGYGTVTGLKGVNCSHDFFPFWEGISVKDPDIKEPDPVVVNGKSYTYYQATQKQRLMERQIRATKREIEAQKAIGGDITDLYGSLKKQTADYHVFSAAVGIRAKDNRLRVVGGSSNLQRTKSYKAMENYVKKKAAGALNNANDPLGRKRDEHAKKYYQEIRKRKSEYVINSIAKHTGIPSKAAKNIYEHIFIKEHSFADGETKRFDPDYDMAESIRRILEGKNIKEHDIVLIKHERLEAQLMRKYNMIYEDAHKLARSKYDYGEALKKFLQQWG